MMKFATNSSNTSRNQTQVQWLKGHCSQNALSVLVLWQITSTLAAFCIGFQQSNFDKHKNTVNTGSNVNGMAEQTDCKNCRFLFAGQGRD